MGKEEESHLLLGPTGIVSGFMPLIPTERNAIGLCMCSIMGEGVSGG